MLNRLVGILLLSATLCGAQEIKIIIAEGVGSDPQNAAQDAAQNALTNVVGSFIDANKQLEKRSEIRDGIRSQTRQIRTDIKEYSQGSIRSFEIVDTKKDGSLFRVTAKVGVRVEDFHAYIKKLAEGETAVGGGLFAEMTTARNQSESLAKILSERILAVVNGEVVKFSVSKPIPFRQSIFADTAKPQAVPAIARLAGRVGPDKLAVFDITATLDPEFLSNFVQTLDSVAASRERVSTAVDADRFGFWNMYLHNAGCGVAAPHESASGRNLRTPTERLGGTRLVRNSGAATINDSGSASQEGDSSFCLPFMDSTRGTATVYRFSHADHELAQYLHWHMSGGSFDVAGELVRGGIRLPTLEIAVLDKNRRELQVELVQGNGEGSQTTALDSPYPWLLYYPLGSLARGAVLLREHTFSVVMKIDDQALRQADSMRVRLIR